MEIIFFIGIIIGGALLLFVTIGLILVAIIKIFTTGGFSKENRQAHANETKMIQDIYKALSRMEERIEVLETILIQKEKKDTEI